MGRYERPVVLANEELAEGVYAASGSSAVEVDEIELTGAGNPYYQVNTYKVVLRNNEDQEITDWSASLSVTEGTATGVGTYSGWFANVALNGNQIVISPSGNGSFAAGGKVEVQITVNYDGDSVKVNGF